MLSLSSNNILLIPMYVGIHFGILEKPSSHTSQFFHLTELMYEPVRQALADKISLLGRCAINYWRSARHSKTSNNLPFLFLAVQLGNNNA